MTNIYSIISNFDKVMPYYARLPSSHNMLKMSTFGRNTRLQTFAFTSRWELCWSLSVASHYKINTFIMSANMWDMTWRHQWRHLLI